MSKRKNRTPNLPKAAVERAREQVEEAADERSEDRAARRAERRAEREKLSVAARRGGLQPAASVTARKKDNLKDSTYLRQALAKPSKFVSEEELHQEYGYVVADIRSMFVLAGALMVLMVVLAQFI